MIRQLYAMIAETPMMAQALAAAVAQSEMGVWAPIIKFLEALLMSCGTLGVIVGAAMISVFSYDDGKRALGWQIIGAAVMGLAIGLLATPLYRVIDGWM